MPRNKWPALNPLVLSFHCWLLSKSSSSKKGTRSPSCGRRTNLNPSKCLSMPLPVAASFVRRLCVRIARCRAAYRVVDWKLELSSPPTVDLMVPTYCRLRVNHCQYPSPTVSGQRSKGLRPTMLEHSGEHGFVCCCEFTVRLVPSKLENHLDVRIRC